eukprot:gene15768-17710_t
MNYNYNLGKGGGYPGYNGMMINGGYGQARPGFSLGVAAFPSQSVPTYQAVAYQQQQSLEARIIQARQANIMYKQRLGQMLLQQQYQAPRMHGSSDDISLSNNYRAVPASNARLNPDLNDMINESTTQKKGPLTEVMLKPMEKPTILDNNSPTPSTAPTAPSAAFPSSSSSSSTYHKQIYDLIDNLDTKANDHNKRLEDCKKEDKDNKKKLKEMKKQEKQEIKEKMEALLQPKDPNDTSKQSIIRLPLWKHKLQGQKKPPPEQVIKGK